MGAEEVGGAPDLALIEAVRAGEGPWADAAFAELYRRHHAGALRFALRLSDPVTAEDLVADAMVRVLRALRAGGGPTYAFRPYLLTTVSNVHAEQGRRGRGGRVVLTGDYEAGGELVQASDPVAAAGESERLARAFRLLPERWQVVLWHTTVEGDDHETVGALLGINANAVAALAFRAREGLRAAYLAAHLDAPADDECGPVREQLPSYVRRRLGKRPAARVEEHLAGCRSCTAAAAELTALNVDLGAVLAPALLGVVGAGYAVPHLSVGSVGGWASSLSPGPVATVASAAVVALVVGGGLVATHEGEAPVAAPRPSYDVAGEPVPGILIVRAPLRRVPASRAPVVTPPATTPPPSPTPTVASSTPTVDPRPTDEPSDQPSQTPDRGPRPTPTPPATPPARVGTDLALSAASATDLGSYRTLTLRVAAPLREAVLTFTVGAMSTYTVHPDGAFPGTACTAAPGAGDLTTITCRLDRAATGALTIDVVADGPLRASARVAAPGNTDPVPSNDTVAFDRRSP